jgi:type I restriction enzyme M protein
LARERSRRRKNANGRQADSGQQAAPTLFPSNDDKLDLGSLETWLWDAACAIRGATDAPKFKD